ncbi:MAG: cation-transporting P-type ATPase [Candidatus Caldatribacteriota bacterium]
MQRIISLKNLKGLTIKSSGLSEAEYSLQLGKFGPNEIVERTGNPWLELLIDTAKDPMVWFLIGTSVIFYIIGDYQEAIILSLATIPLIFMDAFLYWRTQASTAGLKSQLASKVMVIRDGEHRELDSLAIVPGDLIVLSTKNYFLPADGVWEKTDSLQLDESVLTGEAFPVNKSELYLASHFQKDELFIDSGSLGFAGTRVIRGTGYLRVLFTGKDTSYGEIVQSVAKIQHERTPLQSEILELTRFLIYIALAFCLALAAIRFYQGHGWLDALLSAAVLAVAAIPEEFPVVFSFFLGVGVYRLAKRNALVRRAVSVENIGRVTQICTDKTGTITQGELTLTHLDPASDVTEINLLAQALIASDVEGSDPVDVAILKAARLREMELPRRFSVIPFTEDRKRETAFLEKDGELICVIKGSPETVLTKSKLSEKELTHWSERINEWAQGGHKVLAVASVEVREASEPEDGFLFKGLLAFEDPARPEIKDAIKYCQRNEIKVLMITGDHPATAEAIARDIGLIEDSAVIISAEKEPHKIEDNWLANHPDFFKGVDVVARCNPLQKLKIVESLKKAGEMVVVTGDGVNDVPALKASDIGVAMGLRGARSAKEISSIILADDNFSTIVNAIREGKQLFENLRMSFKYLLLLHIPFVLSAAVIPLLGYPLLFLPIHVVWLELIIHPTALFAFQQYAVEKNESSFTQKSFFTKKDSLVILTMGLSLTGIVILFFIAGVSENQSIDHGRAEVMALLSLWSAGLVLALTKGRTLASKVLMIVTVFSTVVLVQNKWFAKALHLNSLHGIDWIKIVSIVLLFVIALSFLSRNSKQKNY